MSRDKSYLFDIYTASELILEYISGVTYQQFQTDIMRQDAIIRRIEIIGEASNNLSAEFKRKYPEIPWAMIRGMRNRLVHEYGEVDLELVWTTSKDDILNLMKNLKPLVNID